MVSCLIKIPLKLIGWSLLMPLIPPIHLAAWLLFYVLPYKILRMRCP